MQLQTHKAEFDAAGIGLVALTYDAPAIQHAFVERFGIHYPLLSDVSATSVRALGILNTEYTPEHSAYGIPFPGIFVVDRAGRVVGKLFLEGFETRVDAAAVLAYALEVLP